MSLWYVVHGGATSELDVKVGESTDEFVSEVTINSNVETGEVEESDEESVACVECFNTVRDGAGFFDNVVILAGALNVESGNSPETIHEVSTELDATTCATDVLDILIGACWFGG